MCVLFLNCYEVSTDFCPETLLTSDKRTENVIMLTSDTDEDGEPDYGLIASIENQIDQTNEELSETEEEISQTSGELQRAQQEYAEVEEEKQQTLFEIQERARITSQDASKASGMFGAFLILEDKHCIKIHLKLNDWHLLQCRMSLMEKHSTYLQKLLKRILETRKRQLNGIAKLF